MSTTPESAADAGLDGSTRVDHAWSMATRTIAAGRPHRPGAPLNVPIVPATSFTAGGDLDYARDSNPTWVAFENVVGDLEGGRAVAFGSGMAAIDAAFRVLMDRVESRCPRIARPHVHYAGSSGLLNHWSKTGRVTLVEYTPGDAADAAAAAQACDVLLVETPSNPTMDITDITAVTQIAHEAGALVMADNTYATPFATRPLALGVDLVVHSASKYFAGHSDALLGVAVAGSADLADELAAQRVRGGGVPGVLEAWLGTRGLRTFVLRMRAATANAGVLAARLSAHPDVSWVRYPGLPNDPGHAVATRQMAHFGAVVTFAPAGGEPRAQQLCEATQLWMHATSLGGVESTLERRRRHVDENPAVPADLIRLSVGCEDVADLWSDLEHALSR